MEGDAGVVAPIGEPTFAVAFESRIDGRASGMSLLIPWSAIEPVAEEILGGGATRDAAPASARGAPRARRRPRLLRAEVGALQMPVEQMLALTPGTLLGLHDRAEEGVRLFAEGVPLGRGRPGLRGAQRAVKLTEAIAGGAGAGRSTNAQAAARRAGTAPRAGASTSGEGRAACSADAESLARMMDVPVRVWAELGRTTLPLGEALELPPGTVVELDQGADAPIELFVNGTASPMARCS